MRFTLENGFNEEQFRWCFMGWGSDDTDAQGAAAAGADYGGGMSDSGQNDAGAGAGMHGGGGGGGSDSGGSDPSGMAGLAAEAEAARGSAPDVAGAEAAIGALDSGYGGDSDDRFRALYQTATVPVERRSPVSVVNPNYVPLDRNYTQADLDKARAQFNDAFSDAYSTKQFGADFGIFKGPFGMYEGIYDAIFDPQAALANQMATRGYASYNGQPVPDSVAGYNPTGLDVVDIGGPLSEGGRVAAYDPRSNTVYDSNPYANLNPFGERTPAEIQALYDRMNAQSEAERQGGDGFSGGGGEPLLIPDETVAEAGAFPTHVPRKYEYQPYVGKFYSIPSRFTKPYGLLS